KLQSFNADHIRGLSPERVREEVRPVLSSSVVAEALEPLADLVQERRRLLTEVAPSRGVLRARPLPLDDVSGEEALERGEAVPEMPDATIERFEALDAWTADAIRVAVEDAATAVGLTNAEGRPQLSKAQAPVRVATTGRSVGPPLFESLEALG